MGALAPVATQCGAVFLIDEAARGVDLFDSPAAFRAMYPKLIRGYALDAVDRGASQFRSHSTSPDRFLKRLQDAEWVRVPAVGRGDSWRVMNPGMSGGALTDAERLVHLSAFVA